MKKKEISKIIVSKNGPYLISGKLPLDKQIVVEDKDNYPTRWKQGEKFPLQEKYALCRCGNSKHKPFCDGTHMKVKFPGTEVASNKPYIKQSSKTIGPDIYLTDAELFCSNAGFCHKAGGTWTLTQSDNSKARATAVQQACNCPSGRLTMWNKKTKKPIEPKFKQSISIIEEPTNNISGPIWVKGNIPIESEEKGTKYEIRNRVTLCRCGKSGNKPFCDGTHVEINFNDGDKDLQ
ncbi:Iron-binding zinc finger CDGSH type [uncultured archaeon]|nr:Iron-binding zinc finger CDGSH type [uncultured archaeon]